MTTQNEAIYECVKVAVEAIGIDSIKAGPFFGIGEAVKTSQRELPIAA